MNLTISTLVSNLQIIACAGPGKTQVVSACIMDTRPAIIRHLT